MQTPSAYQELLGAVVDLDARWHEPGVIDDEQSQLEGYKWALGLISVATDVFVCADSARPRFVDIVGPYRKFNGDNVDAFYQFAPIDPSRTYRITGRTGDAVYLSLTVYGAALDKTTDRVVDTDHIVAIVNDRDLDIEPDGTFELWLSAVRPSGVADRSWLQLTREGVCAITRDYLDDPRSGRRVEWHIEAVDPPANFRENDADLAARFRAAARWVRQHGEMCPVPLGPVNVVADPYPVPKVTRGWAAGDAAYASGAFELADSEALVVRGSSPECRFWNLCLWNPFLTTSNYDYERVSINGSQVQYEPDGSWVIHVAPRDTGHPNWVSTAGHRRGRLWFRWFYPEFTPERPTTEVVRIV